MKKYSRYGKLLGILLVGSLFCSACTGSSGKERKQAPKTQTQTDLPEENLTEKPKNESKDQASASSSEIQDTGMEPAADASAEPAADSESENLQKEQPMKKVVETDWSEYFDGLHGETDEDDYPYPIYGKTGMGVAHGATVDAWYTGFMERPEGNVYFCVWLGQTDGREVSSAIAREIAVRILSQESADHSFAVR